MLEKIVRKLTVPVLVGALTLSTPNTAIAQQKKQEKTDKVFTALTISYVGLSGYEVYQTIDTYERLKNNPNFTFYEINPVMRPLVKHKPLLIGIKALEIAGTTYLINELKKDHKKLAYIAIIGMNIFRAYAVYHNYREAQKIK